MRHGMKLLFGLSIFVSALVVGARALINTQDAASVRPTTSSQQPLPTRGEVVFRQNCSRCHSSPQGFSSRISGTVSKHMRVRANLSDADYKELMRFLNP
jgi:cytochrome c5